MFVFQNLMFVIEHPQNPWEIIGYKTKHSDGRIIDIQPIQIRNENAYTISVQMHAKIQLKTNPETSSDGIVSFPKDETSALNNTLRYYSRLVSVSDMCKVSISSPMPSRGFIPESSAEKAFLDTTQGFEGGLTMQMCFTGNFFEQIYKDQLFDRQEGVRIMSNINSQNDPLSQFRELIRLFENGFAATSNQLASLLFEFLQTSKILKYEKSEIYSWITGKRDGASHADLKKSSKVIHGEDINPDIQRILQAGYDVLFNKESWYSNSIQRRELLKLAMAINKDAMVISKSEVEKKIGMDLLPTSDPLYFTGKKKEDIAFTHFTAPPEWWTKRMQPKERPF